MINTIISALLQVLVFSIIPFLAYLILRKKIHGFLGFIGLKRSNARANLYGLLIALLVGVPFLIFSIINQEFYEILTDPKSVSGAIRNIDNKGVLVATILISAVLKTSLSEEILFRGFLAKRLIAITNFTTGNIIQAVVFGIIHSLLFMTVTDNVLFVFLIFLFPTVSAYLKTYVNEKHADGSIIPGWIAHATGNIISYSSIALL